ncbi:protoglobin domain-containing protein [Sphingobium sufflavum]|uniref:protoglobin domain-containing protein n=1 Tax=Sphingobium sufflavum TaxID=1129547 RepID=UPI001F32FDB5|nr:protoglobin domain-containing protein [Sphingobium sufflavum]
MDSAKNAQRAHWLDAFANGINDEYFRRAVNIGRVHARIGLKPQWYIGGYALVAEHMIDGMVAPGLWRFVPGRRALARRLPVFVKVAMLDMDVALSTYFDETEDKIRQVVDQLGNALAALAASDLTPQVSNLPGEYGCIQADFNGAVSSLRGTALCYRGDRSLCAGASKQAIWVKSIQPFPTWTK